MTKLLIYKLLLICIACLSVACTEEKLVYDEIGETYRLLQGEWQWVKTVSPRTQIETNPETEGYQESILFNTKDTVEYYRNQDWTSKYPYKIKYRINNSLDTNSDSILVLVINNGTESFFSTENDSLVINQAYVDGPVTYYKRSE